MTHLVDFLNLHPSMAAALGLSIFLLVANEVLALMLQLPSVSPQQLVALMNRREAVIFDVREASAFQQGHINGALSMELADLAQKASWLRQKYKNKLMVLVANDTVPFSRALFQLKKENIPLKYLAGGVQAWRDQGLPIET